MTMRELPGGQSNPLSRPSGTSLGATMKLHDLPPVNENEATSAPHKAPRIWILVADHHIARVFRKEPGGLSLVTEAKPTKHQSGKSLSKDNMGRHNTDSFAHEIAGWLERAVYEDLFDRLILIAAPRTLGDIRKYIGKSVEARIVAEVDKELTKFNADELREELKDLLWF